MNMMGDSGGWLKCGHFEKVGQGRRTWAAAPDGHAVALLDVGQRGAVPAGRHDVRQQHHLLVVHALRHLQQVHVRCAQQKLSQPTALFGSATPRQCHQADMEERRQQVDVSSPRWRSAPIEVSFIGDNHQPEPIYVCCTSVTWGNSPRQTPCCSMFTPRSSEPCKVMCPAEQLSSQLNLQHGDGL